MAPLQLTSKNWMAGIPDRTRLSELYIPGTHDTATSYLNMSKPFAEYAQTQDRRATYNEQLSQGIRYFDLRFQRKFEDVNFRTDKASYWQLFHGDYFLDTNLRDALLEIQNFLKENPSEVVYVQLQPGDAWGEVNPYEYRTEIIEDPRWKNNPSLSKNNPSSESLYHDPDRLWVTSWQDLDDIRKLRPYKGLGGLNASYVLSQPRNASIKVDSSSPVDDPRKFTFDVAQNKNVYVPFQNSRLDYSGLAVGDVRGKIIPIESQFKYYSGNGWNVPGQHMDPLERQDNPDLYTTGVDAQDNWDGPLINTKWKDINNFALKGDYGRKLPLNFASAAGFTPPYGYAGAINAGPSSSQYKVVGVDSSLANSLNINIFDANSKSGASTNHNVTQKLNNKLGLAGVLAGDYMTTSSNWYDDYNKYDLSIIPPMPDSSKYSSSDWLTQKIWRQSAIVTPTLLSPSNARDKLTGLPLVKEGGAIELSWNDYLGVIKTGNVNSSLKINDGASDWQLNYRVTKVDGVSELGLSATSSRALGNSSPTTFDKSTGRSKRQFNNVGDSVQKGFDFDARQNSYLETFSVVPTPGIQGDRFFRIDLMASKDGANWNAIGASSYFMVTD